MNPSWGVGVGVLSQKKNPNIPPGDFTAFVFRFLMEVHNTKFGAQNAENGPFSLKMMKNNVLVVSVPSS